MGKRLTLGENLLRNLALVVDSVEQKADAVQQLQREIQEVGAWLQR